MYVYGFINWLKHKFDKDERETIKMFGKIPYTCRRCELLGLCRRQITKKGEVGKCYNGCLIINQKKEKK